MAHLVSSFVARNGAYKSIESYFEEIQEAQRYLSENGAKTFQRAVLEKGECWGTGAKRIRVKFTTGPRPTSIRQDVNDQRLAEVVNQCANIERLLDALQWARNEPSLQGYAVGRCHPTTGSSKGDDDDHDLVLVEEDSPEHKAKFEVSDVAGVTDGNNKEKKDLASLGVLKKGSFQPADEWPDGRLFLVASKEFGRRLTRRRIRIPHYCCEIVGRLETTRVVEVTRRAVL